MDTAGRIKKLREQRDQAIAQAKRERQVLDSLKAIHSGLTTEGVALRSMSHPDPWRDLYDAAREVVALTRQAEDPRAFWVDDGHCPNQNCDFGLGHSGSCGDNIPF